MKRVKGLKRGKGNMSFYPKRGNMSFTLSNCLVDVINGFTKYPRYLDKIDRGFYSRYIGSLEDVIISSIRNGYTDLIRWITKQGSITFSLKRLILRQAISISLPMYKFIIETFEREKIDCGVNNLIMLLIIAIKNRNLEMVQFIIINQKAPVLRDHYLDAKCSNHPTIFEFIKSVVDKKQLRSWDLK